MRRREFCQLLAGPLLLVRLPAPAATGVPTMSTPSASGARKIADLNGFAIPQLGGCLTKIAAGRKVLLADVARYLGTPAAISDSVEPHTDAIEVEPLDCMTSDTTRRV